MVDWDFLESCLYQIGIGDKWRSWMNLYLSSTYFPEMVNDSPKAFPKS